MDDLVIYAKGEAAALSELVWELGLAAQDGNLVRVYALAGFTRDKANDVWEALKEKAPPAEAEGAEGNLC